MLANMIEPSMCGSDVALCQISLTTCFKLMWLITKLCHVVLHKSHLDLSVAWYLHTSAFHFWEPVVNSIVYSKWYLLLTHYDRYWRIRQEYIHQTDANNSWQRLLRWGPEKFC